MDNLIQQLKDNEKPFGLMSEEMQAKAHQIVASDKSGTDFRRYNGRDWDIKSNLNTLCRDDTYRLRADYEEKPGIVECEIQEVLIDEDHYMKQYKGMDGQWFRMMILPDGYETAGFKFAGTKQIINKDFGFSHNGIDILPFVDYDNLKSGRYDIYHATHVLFRSKK